MMKTEYDCKCDIWWRLQCKLCSHSNRFWPLHKSDIKKYYQFHCLSRAYIMWICNNPCDTYHMLHTIYTYVHSTLTCYIWFTVGVIIEEIILIHIFGCHKWQMYIVLTRFIISGTCVNLLFRCELKILIWLKKIKFKMSVLVWICFRETLWF